VCALRWNASLKSRGNVDAGAALRSHRIWSCPLLQRLGGGQGGGRTEGEKQRRGKEMYRSAFLRRLSRRHRPADVEMFNSDSVGKSGAIVAESKQIGVCGLAQGLLARKAR